ncbi:MAG: hypothetical protein JSW63_02855 [Ignavibacterium sp.]|nr:MAG: hypothetical protein JSW63_02855 [Ignavibacterium sp.]
MIKRVTFIIVPILLVSNAFAQIEPGARQISLSHSDIALSNDVFSLFNNPSGLSQISWREVGIYYSPAPFGLSELANGYVAYIEPFNFGSVAIGGMTYGFDLYRESRIVLGYSYNYENKFFAGAAINLHTFSIQNYGNASAFYFNFGGLAYITKEIRWGFSISNLNRASIGNEDDQIPMVFATGFSYDLINTLSLNLGINKDIRYKPSVKFGIEYDIIKYLSLRIGFQNEPSKYSAGIGINYSFVNFDYALFTHQDLGITHQAGIVISFGREGTRSKAIRSHLGIE